MPKVGSKQNWSLSPAALERLLDWLDEGRDSAGENYLKIHTRLVNYFDRKNCLRSDELADETLHRVARRIEEEGSIKTETPAKYCYIVARFVFLESLRAKDKLVPLDEIREPQAADGDAEVNETEVKERMLDCLERCSAKLDLSDRELIYGYYFGIERVKIENRRFLAAKLGISSNALSIRACRIRGKLESCVVKCARENGDTTMK